MNAGRVNGKKISIKESYEKRLGREFCEQNLAAHYSSARKAAARLTKQDPQLAKQLTASLDSQWADNMKLLDELLAEEDARKEASGLDRAERDRDAAADAELSAFSDVCAYRCNSLEEAKLKAKYLLTTYMVRDGWDDEAIALLKSFSAA
jgi:hypothetical protein